MKTNKPEEEERGWTSSGGEGLDKVLMQERARFHFGVVDHQFHFSSWAALSDSIHDEKFQIPKANNNE